MVSEIPRHSLGEQGNTAADKLVPHAGIRAYGHAGMRGCAWGMLVPMPHTAWSTQSVIRQSSTKVKKVAWNRGNPYGS